MADEAPVGLVGWTLALADDGVPYTDTGILDVSELEVVCMPAELICGPEGDIAAEEIVPSMPLAGLTMDEDAELSTGDMALDCFKVDEPYAGAKPPIDGYGGPVVEVPLALFMLDDP